MAGKLIGLHINEKKKYMTFNQNPSKLTTISKKRIKLPNDFLYLGACIYSNKKDADVRMGCTTKTKYYLRFKFPKKLEISIFPYYIELCAILWI